LLYGNISITTVTPGIQRVQALADISRLRYVVIAMKPVHQLQIHSIVHNEGAPPTIPPSYIWVVRTVVWTWGDGQTHAHTDTCDQHTFRVVYNSHEM